LIDAPNPFREKWGTEKFHEDPSIRPPPRLESEFKDGIAKKRTLKKLKFKHLRK